MVRLPWTRKERVCLVTAYNSHYETLARLTVPRMKAICEVQGYELRSIKTDDCTRRGGWIKIGPIRKILEERFDWLLWVDIDALFIRTNIDIRREIRSRFDLQMVWHVPQEAPYLQFTPHFNSGIMLIRCCDWTRDFFSRVWDKGQLPHPSWADQATILHLLGFDDILKLGPHRSNVDDRSRVGTLDIAWNTIPGVATCRDPIVHHYAGITNPNTRLRIIRLDAASVAFRESRWRLKRARYAALFHQLRHHATMADDIEAKILSLDPSIAKRLSSDGST